MYLPGAKILVVDDERMVRETIREFLLEESYEVTQAADAGAAKELLAQERYDVVISDVIMPGLSGLDLTEHIREDQPTVEIILITGEPDTAIISRAVRAGAIDYITKPITGEVIKKSVASAVRRKKISDENLRLAEENRQYQQQLEKLVAERTAALSDSEARLKLLIGAVGQALGLVVLDRAQKIIENNELFVRDFGDCVGRKFLAVFPMSCEGPLSIVDSVIAEGKPRSIDCHVEISETEQRWYRMLAAPILGGRNSADSVMILMEDMTELKKAERAREEAENELKAQQMMAMKSDRLRSLGEMAAGIAHELNQPLMGVRGLAEHMAIAIERGWELTEEKIIERSTTIVEQADRMSDIIDHMRMFARKAAEGETTRVSLNDVVKSAISVFGAQLKSHGVHYTMELAENLPAIVVNPFSLEEVILNLLSNARDSVEAKAEKSDSEYRPKIRLLTADTELNGKLAVKVEISDNGEGVEKGVEDKIFDPFFTTKPPNRASGLGLPISRSLVEEMSGEITLEPGEDGGAVARIILPTEPVK